jgi:hypothetical protein
VTHIFQQSATTASVTTSTFPQTIASLAPSYSSVFTVEPRQFQIEMFPLNDLSTANTAQIFYMFYWVDPVTNISIPATAFQAFSTTQPTKLTLMYPANLRRAYPGGSSTNVLSLTISNPAGSGSSAIDFSYRISSRWGLNTGIPEVN